MFDLKEHKLTLISAGCAALVIGAWFLGYLPATARLETTKKELAALKKEITDIQYAGLKESRNIKELAEFLRKSYLDTQKQLPAKEEDMVRFVSDEANKLKVDILSMQPGARRIFSDENNLPVALEGKQIFELPLSVTVRGQYRLIGEYLKAISDADGILIRVRTVKIAKDDATTTLLRAQIELTVFLLI
ncbi:MAG: type 4a pilus biogenesis protein PilO [Candidatus Omnitrophota bacterium]